VARRVDDQVVVVHLGTNQVYSLNKTGGRLWELLADGLTPGDAFTRMTEEFVMPESVLRDEVDQFLELLLRKQLVRAERP
jgi:hypothetical protein